MTKPFNDFNIAFNTCSAHELNVQSFRVIVTVPFLVIPVSLSGRRRLVPDPDEAFPIPKQ